MSSGRSSAYWSGNRYADPEVEPERTAPLTDLPAASAGRFKLVRDGLLAIDGVAESVRYMGASWRWSWEYGIGSRKLCWLHVVGNGISTTFTLSDMEESRLRGVGRLPADPSDSQRPASSVVLVLAGPGRPAHRGRLSDLRPAEGRVAERAAGSAPGAAAPRLVHKAAGRFGSRMNWSGYASGSGCAARGGHYVSARGATALRRASLSAWDR